MELLTQYCPDRLHTIFSGILILETLILQSRCTTVYVCKYGVREGYLLARVLGEPLEDQSKITPST